jgi:hypothetical protein
VATGNIREGFEAPAGLTIQPTEVGVEAAAAAARRGGAFFNQAGQDFDTLGQRAGSAIRDAGDAYVKYAAHQEISHGAATFAQLHSDLTNQWNDTAKNADPNDPSIAGKFNDETLNPALEKFRSAFSTEAGQNWAESHIDALRSHMFEKTAADMSTLAGDAVTVNVRKMTNAWTNTARNDPSAVPYLLSTAESSINGVVQTSPNLKGVNAAKVTQQILQATKEQIVKAGALGAIESSADPEKAAATFAQRYPDYVNSQEIDQFAKAAKYYKRIGDSETRAARVQADYENKNDFNTKINNLEASTMPQKPGDPPQLPPDYWDKLRDLSMHPGAALEPGRLRSMVQQGEIITDRLNKPEPIARVSHDTTMDLLGQIRSGKMPDNTAIYDAYQKGNLTRADFAFLNTEFGNLRTPDGQRLGTLKQSFLHGIEPSIDKSVMGVPDPDGKERFYQLQFELERRMAEFRKQGKDPYSLLDPSSPDYMGKPETLKQFQNPMTRQISDAVRGAGGVNPTSQNDWQKREPGTKSGIPPVLRGIAALAWDKDVQRYRDQTTGKIYDRNGVEVK